MRKNVITCADAIPSRDHPSWFAGNGRPAGGEYLSRCAPPGGVPLLQLRIAGRLRIEWDLVLFPAPARREKELLDRQPAGRTWDDLCFFRTRTRIADPGLRRPTTGARLEKNGRLDFPGGGGRPDESSDCGGRQRRTHAHGQPSSATEADGRSIAVAKGFLATTPGSGPPSLRRAATGSTGG